MEPNPFANGAKAFQVIAITIQGTWDFLAADLIVYDITSALRLIYNMYAWCSLIESIQNIKRGK